MTQQLASPSNQEPGNAKTWKKLVWPCLLALIFQYAYMAYFIGLRTAMVLAIIDGGVLLSMDVNNSSYLYIWVGKCLVQWPLLGFLGSKGYLDRFSGPDRPDRDKIIDAVLMGGMTLVVAANLIMMIRKIL